ncbi:putative T7SS-secreted protein [Gordonia mangrovi]|uniref:putative T7SS-secreted protein n=1 Tax=Gordonia mangrovi TaxID=2665643 RepID=UPI00136BAF87|nr:DUF6531 domain-containing protein [Gordonia mangrovi]UVF77106.1 DUF6531 domain-containing protein [Gordonia mangrovi]
MGLFDGLADGVNRLGDAAGDALESAAEHAGQAVDAGLDAAAGVARGVGADGVAEALDDAGDKVASITGGAVDERELGETEDKRELIRGDSGKINESASTLNGIGADVGSTGSALRQVDAAGWTGEGADAFNAVFDQQPALWSEASAAMEASSAQLSAWASTVEWAQSQAHEAIAIWKEAENEERAKKAAYNALSGEERAATPLVDSWTAKYEEARRILKSARTERDNIAGDIAGAIAAHTATAPTEPPFLNRMAANVSDATGVAEHARLTFSSGVTTSLTGIVQFARQLSPTDPYNITHPAEFIKGSSDLVTGMIVAAADPGATVDAVLSDARANPFETMGSLTGDAILTAATGGGGAAAALGKNAARVGGIGRDALGAARGAERAVDAARPTARPGGHPVSPDAASGAESKAAEASEGSRSEQPSVHASEQDAPDDRGSEPDGQSAERESGSVAPTGNDGPSAEHAAHADHGGDSPGSIDDSAETLSAKTDSGGQSDVHSASGPADMAVHDHGAASATDEAGAASDQTSHEVTAGRDPVDLATGEFLLPETDLTLPSVLPLTIGRRHRSGYRFGRWFGPTWSSTLDMRIVVEDSGVTLLAEDGVMLTYPHPRVDEPVTARHSQQRWTMSRTDGGGYRVTDPDRDLTWHFAPKSELVGLDVALGNLSISAITDRHHNRIRFHYNERGEPVEIRHSGGYRVHVEAHGGRIRSLAVGLDDGATPRVVREFHYESGQLTSVSSASGGATTYAYDEYGRMLSWRDSNDNEMRNTYDGDGRVVRQDGTGGIMSAEFEYLTTGTGSVTVVTDSSGARSAHGFDADLRLRDRQLPSGARTHTDFNPRRAPLEVTAPDGAVTRYLYTPDGDVAELVRPDGAAIRVDYAAPGCPSAVHHADGTVTRQEWDTERNLVAVTDQRGARTEYTYRSDGTIETVVDAAGGITRVLCDPAGLPVQVTDPAGATTLIDRDAFGRPKAVTDPLGRVTTYEWTPDGKLLRRGNPDATEDLWSYDGEGNLLRHIDPAGAHTVHTYGAFDLLASTTAPDGTVTSYTWDTERRLVGVTNPLGQTWAYTYDGDGRLTAETDFSGARTDYTHEATGRVTSVTPATGVTRRLRYDVLGQLVETRADSGEFRNYTYDLAGRCTTAVSGVGDTVTHTVNFRTTATGVTSAESIDGESVVRISHDIAGRRIERRSSSGAVTSWQWGPAGELSAMIVDGRRIGFEHDIRGALTKWSVGELAVSRAYDAGGKLSGQRVLTHPEQLLDLGLGGSTRPEPLVIRADTYDYRADGFLTGQATTTPREVRQRTLDLDPVGRITCVVDNDAVTEEYAYDALSNVVGQQVASATSIDRDSMGRREFRGNLLVRDGRTRYSYDAAARLVRKSVGRLSRPTDVWHYRYDAFDQLAEVTTPDGVRWVYTYDALGRRITKARLDSAGNITDRMRFVWDGETVIEQHSADEATRWSYRPGTHTPLTQTCARFAPDQDAVDAEFFAIVTDLVGSPTELVVPESGEVVGHAASTVWGSTTWSGAQTPIRFPGQYFDGETGWHYNLHRYYNPETARYVTQDPLGLAPSPNPAGYPFNPTAWVDPLGLVPEPCLEGTAIEGARRVSGRFPELAQPGEVLYRSNGPQVTSYQAYDSDGSPLQRVDVTGRAHGGVPTPHVMVFERHFAPDGNLFIKESKEVRPATPEETRGLR